MGRPEADLPGFVRWATPADPGAAAHQTDIDAGRAAWFRTASIPTTGPGGFEWRLPAADRFERDRPCSGVRCERNNGVRPIVAMLDRWRAPSRTRGRGRRSSSVVTFAYCDRHAAAYGVYPVGGRLLWLRVFR